MIRNSLIRRPYLDVVVSGPDDRVKFLANIFCEISKMKFDDPEDKANELNLVLDDMERLSEQFEFGLEARKAVSHGLQSCWNNLPAEKEIANVVKPRIMHTAALNGTVLERNW